MKRSCKGLWPLLFMVPSYTALADTCSDLMPYEVKVLSEEHGVKTFCDEELKVLFGYDTHRKAPAWAVYEVKPSDQLIQVRNHGHYQKTKYLGQEEQRNSSEIVGSEFDHGYLVPPYQVVKHPVDIVHAYNMNNIVPISKTVWRGTMENQLFQLTKDELQYAKNKGKFIVTTALNYSRNTAELQMPVSMLKSYFQPDTKLSLSLVVPFDEAGTASIRAVDCIEQDYGIDLYSGMPFQEDLENNKATSTSVWSRLDGNEDQRGTQCEN